MQQIKPYVDSRLTHRCVYCDGEPDTGDHVPPRAFLDKPYPANLPKVPSCQACNEGASLDEEYVSCLLEVAACGSVRPEDLQRPGVARKLQANDGLRQRLAQALTSQGGRVAFVAEVERLSRVVEKVGRGLWAFETGEPTALLIADVWFAAIPSLSKSDVANFMTVGSSDVFPEVGSRRMFRHTIVEDKFLAPAWQEVQALRFSYAIEMSDGSCSVKMILRDYLVGRVSLG
ncbi:MAG TPA: hypothetical protein VFQ44_28735 [Streptosporangiaceae bacterium]|nr:hypothetical protein [Streptosporangiaceae bacterium]